MSSVIRTPGPGPFVIAGRCGAMRPPFTSEPSARLPLNEAASCSPADLARLLHGLYQISLSFRLECARIPGEWGHPLRPVLSGAARGCDPMQCDEYSLAWFVWPRCGPMSQDRGPNISSFLLFIDFPSLASPLPLRLARRHDPINPRCHGDTECIERTRRASDLVQLNRLQRRDSAHTGKRCDRVTGNLTQCL